MDRSKELGTGRIPALLVKFSIPAIVGMLVNAIYNIVDRIFIGRGVGPLGIAGATIAFPIMLVQMAFSMLIGVGATTLVSLSLGERNVEKAERVLGNAFALIMMVSATLTAAGLLFLEPLLMLFGASQTILPYARDYTSVILAGTVFQAIGMGMNSLIRGEGNPRMAMATMLIGAVLNTVLDPIFIFVFGWGVSGAALATIISQGVSAAWVLGYYLTGKSHLRLRRRNFRLSVDTVAAIVSIGSAPFVMQSASSILNGLMNNQLQRYGGDLAVSAMGIIFSVAMLFFMPIFGLNQGAQPIIGYNFGARSFARVKSATLLTIVAATALMLAGFCAIQFSPRLFIGLFVGSSPELFGLGVHAIRIYFLMLPLIGFQIVAANYFQAVGKPRQAMFLSLSRQVLVLIPLIVVLPLSFGLEGLWYAPPVADVISSILTAAFFIAEIRRLSATPDAPAVHPAGEA
ncbi:MAG: MATE family efflux transporter [Spirochaetes bacterium]|nr:MATE family efflux transporter [Spirochaetota bacterium]